MNSKSEIGKIGEDLASKYLINKGFKIIERNFRKPWGELDIITKSPEGVLVFVEVKTIRQRNNSANGNSAIAAILPEDNLTSSKLTKLKRTAYLYANENFKLINDEKGWRIDLLAITLNESGEISIKHFENI